MQEGRLKPNGSSLAGILPAVAQFGSLQVGKSCHGFIIRNGLDKDEFVMTALMDMYAKSGDLSVARKLFDTMPSRSVVSWSAMIAGYGTHGCAVESLSLFDRMLAHSIQPNYITYIGVLSACVHAGYVDKGRLYFQQMVKDHGISPRLQHYTCMVDLLGRAGLLEEAMDLIREMPAKPSPDVWGALLGACRIHGNVILGKYAADKLFELNPLDPGFYVLLSNMYAAAHMWSEVRRVRALMRDLGLRKPAGWSSIEIGSKVHSFISGDKSHSDSDEIYKRLDELTKKLKKLGYLPKTEVVLHDVEDGVKESVLSSHSEKLAMAYGLLRLTPGAPIRIMKNLRTCEDCHAFAKFVSKVSCREIVLRDAVRFHHIKHGVCTCSDYW
uniref:Pentatricopeptide repeat-containing protein At2g01510, mitochondrial n=2 Tax=Anthurium amnicola TaxID=1678845 RepID=A0A1D1Z605_9ARAE